MASGVEERVSITVYSAVTGILLVQTFTCHHTAEDRTAHLFILKDRSRSVLGAAPALGVGPGEGLSVLLAGLRPRHDEDLREPLVRRQGSQVSMRVARGSASWLSSRA